VIASSAEIAREAAAAVAVAYSPDAHNAEFDPNSTELYKPEKVNPSFPADTSEGDVDAAMASAAHAVDQTYSTALMHNNPLEPHATVAVWSDSDGLTLYDSTQGVHAVRSGIAPVLGLDEEKIRVISPHVGGGFGSKGMAHPHVILAALAAMTVRGQAVKLALTRQQMFFLVGYRTPTIQRIRLAADDEGRLTALAHDVIEQTSRIEEFAEQTAVASRSMYAATNRSTSHRLVPLDVPVPSWMRAPGECPGMFAPEVALDELAIECGIDPIELRIRNDPDVDPDSGNPWSSRDLVECLRIGAERFGWSERNPEPRSRLEDGWLVGVGVTSSVYHVYRMSGTTASITHTDGRYVVRIGCADIGTGARTALTQIAADALGVPVEPVRVEIADTRFPPASVAGGSSGTTTWGSAIVAAAEALRRDHGDDPAEGLTVEADTPENPDEDDYAMFAFGAQFAEIRVHADTGELRATRLLGIFDAGRIINPRTARSQFIGGMTMGLSMALHEQSFCDPRFGHVVNHDLAEYHIAANADAVSIEAEWLDRPDPHTNPMGSKGIGEIGIVGTAAAVANAAYNATGIRVRDLPLTADKFLGVAD
jgi:xanthine dehydrogenase YagR molybdenum-binding subunit